MPKDYVNVRVGVERRSEIDQLVVEGKYENVSEFVIQAIDKHLHPDRDKKEFKEKLLDLLDNDPDIRNRISGSLRKNLIKNLQE